MRDAAGQYFRIFRPVFLALGTALGTALAGTGLAAAAEQSGTRPKIVVPEIELPDPELQRPLSTPLTRPEDRGQRLLERGRLENRRQRLERGRDPHDSRVQDRLRRLDRSIDGLR
jgi:hypothetical protein